MLVKELLALSPDVIVAQSTALTAAFRRESRNVPIVFIAVGDPIGAGFIASLARPGGNLTGLTLYEGIIAGKWLNGQGATFLRRCGGSTFQRRMVGIIVKCGTPVSKDAAPPPATTSGDHPSMTRRVRSASSAQTSR
jgi:hypothetical protein